MTDLVTYESKPLAAQGDFLEAFGAFLRLNVADGDASPETVRAHAGRVAHFTSWCRESDVEPARATEADLVAYRRALLDDGYARSTVDAYLGAVRRFFEAAMWRGLREDNPAAGLKAPRDKTDRAERTKYLPLDGLRRLLEAPQGKSAESARDRAILVLMGIHGLRVSEVAGRQLEDLDLEAGTARVTGKGSKTRTVYLVAETLARLSAWLTVRGSVATGGEGSLFVALDRRTAGSCMTARAIRYTVDGYLEDLSLKAEGVSCHSLRQTLDSSHSRQRV